jgi:hypothetical protein
LNESGAPNGTQRATQSVGALESKQVRAQVDELSVTAWQAAARFPLPGDDGVPQGPGGSETRCTRDTGVCTGVREARGPPRTADRTRAGHALGASTTRASRAASTASTQVPTPWQQCLPRAAGDPPGTLVSGAGGPSAAAGRRPGPPAASRGVSRAPVCREIGTTARAGRPVPICAQGSLRCAPPAARGDPPQGGGGRKSGN